MTVNPTSTYGNTCPWIPYVDSLRRNLPKEYSKQLEIRMSSFHRTSLPIPSNLTVFLVFHTRLPLISYEFTRHHQEANICTSFAAQKYLWIYKTPTYTLLHPEPSILGDGPIPSNQRVKTKQRP
jgi:hypothetical protein